MYFVSRGCTEAISGFEQNVIELKLLNCNLAIYNLLINMQHIFVHNSIDNFH